MNIPIPIIIISIIGLYLLGFVTACILAVSGRGQIETENQILAQALYEKEKDFDEQYEKGFRAGQLAKNKDLTEKFCKCFEKMLPTEEIEKMEIKK